LPDSALSHLLDQLQHHQPKRLLLASNCPPPEVLRWADKAKCQVTQVYSRESFPNDLQRFPFAVVTHYLEELDKTTGIQRLGQLRNLYSERVWVEVHDHSTWRFNDFLGLGFKHLSYMGETEKNSHCYGYDLGSYNHVRSWNNPKNWANPENFNKYRW